MKEIVKQYLDQSISRRKLVLNLVAAGMSTVAAKTMAQSLEPVAAPAKTAVPETRGSMRTMTATGGMLYVQQLKAAGVKYIFANPSTGDAPIYDALVSEREIQLIKGIQEGACVAMGDGYARMSGRTAIVQIAGVGLPNGLTQMVNTFKDHIPLLLTIAGGDERAEDGPQDYDFQNEMVAPISKWRWTPTSGSSVPEITRRVLKFASTPPGGPVFLSIPGSVLHGPATATIMDQALFDVPMWIRPDKDAVERAARMLLEAKNPLLSIGDEVTLCRGEKELLELAELLSLPVSDTSTSALGPWSRPFPTRHPLYIGATLRDMRFPGAVDVHLNIGSRYGEIAMPGAKLISIRQDPTSLARNTPVDVPMVADVRLATIDLIAAIRSMATAGRLKEIADERAARTHDYTSKRLEMLEQISKSAAYVSSSIRLERLAFELEKALDRQTIYVTDCDSGAAMDPLMSFGGSDKTYVSTGPHILGWAVAGSFGVQLARPDRPVVSILGDGSMLFGGPQPLWSLSRYQCPVTVIVFNNRSYNNERNRSLAFGQGAQLQEGIDMLCYNGSPDVDFGKAAAAFGVEGELVTEPDRIAAALERAKRANVEGRPYLLDIHVDRVGVGAASTWYPRYSIAAERTKKV